eukprot:2607513-Amphidinium_carterae.1
MQSDVKVCFPKGDKFRTKQGLQTLSVNFQDRLRKPVKLTDFQRQVLDAHSRQQQKQTEPTVN